jgi:hypothetical protein
MRVSPQFDPVGVSNHGVLKYIRSKLETPTTIPPGFSGMQWQPDSEQEVVFLFGLLFQSLPISLAIDEIRTAYPDCLARNTKTGEPVRIEFELYGSNFRNHGHDDTLCDVVVCWRDDRGDWPETIRVIELEPILSKKLPLFILNDRPKREPRLWDKTLFDNHANEDVRRLIGLLQPKVESSENVRLLYNGRGKNPTCNVCLTPGDIKILWIWADGGYQWCWGWFHDEPRKRPDIVKLFQELTGSRNKNDCSGESLDVAAAAEIVRRIAEQAAKP